METATIATESRGFPVTGHQVCLTRLPDGIGMLPPAAIRGIAGDLASIAFPPGVVGALGEKLRRREVVVAWEDHSGAHEVPVVVMQIRGDSVVVRRRVEQQREYFRVLVRLPLFYEVIPESRLNEILESVALGVPSGVAADPEYGSTWVSGLPHGTIEEQLSQVRREVRAVSDKLERLLALVEGRSAPAPGVEAVELTDLSAVGVGFRSARPLAEGTHLKLRIQHTKTAGAEIVAVGHVVHCAVLLATADGPSYGIGVEFDFIHTVDREKIFRLVSRIEQKMLQDFNELMNP